MTQLRQVMLSQSNLASIKSVQKVIDFHCSNLYKDSYLAGNGRFDISDFVIEAPLTLFDEEIGCTLLAVPAEFSFLRKMGKFLIWTLDSGQFSTVVSFFGILGIEGIVGREGILPSLTYFSKYVFPRVQQKKRPPKRRKCLISKVTVIFLYHFDSYE